MVTLNRAVAVAMVHGPHAGLELLATLDADERMAGHHRLDAVRAHLLEMAGDRAGARASYRTAARRTTSLPEQRYLEARAAALTGDAGQVSDAGPSVRSATSTGHECRPDTAGEPAHAADHLDGTAVDPPQLDK